MSSNSPSGYDIPGPPGMPAAGVPDVPDMPSTDPIEYRDPSAPITHGDFKLAPIYVADPNLNPVQLGFKDAVSAERWLANAPPGEYIIVRVVKFGFHVGPPPEVVRNVVRGGTSTREASLNRKPRKPRTKKPKAQPAAAQEAK